MNCFFITGTDTNVGKTIACRAIIQSLQQAEVQVVGYKPVACGVEDPVYSDVKIENESDYSSENNPDVLTLISSTKENVTYQDVNSYSFSNTMPMLTTEVQRIDIDKINHDLACLFKKYRSVVVEGSYGWLTPINQEYTFASWAESHRMPVILVVGIKQGCINHALLTAQAIRQSGLQLQGWIANRINPGLSHYSEIIRFLSDKIDAPLIGKIPYIHKPEEQELGQYITGIEHLVRMIE